MGTRRTAIVLLLSSIALCQICNITVPANPLTAQGLSTPYLTEGCDQANANEATFVQGAVINLDTGEISVYNPLVINKGTQPAIPPKVPTLPSRFVAAVWFGTNAGGILLQGGASLVQGACVNGLTTPFGQFGYCNAPAFFLAANSLIASGQLVVPPLGTATDGLPCPTLRDYFVVDQDQSDNVDTTYFVSSGNKIAQATQANARTLGATKVEEVNGSDNRLLNFALGAALGCNPWKVADLADPGQLVAALPLNELQAAKFQSIPYAIIPSGDPMVLENNQPSLAKLNKYRQGVNQVLARSLQDADTTKYCRNLNAIQPPRLLNNMALFKTNASPAPTVANNLYTFLAQRYFTSFGPDGLNCAGLLGVANPITLTTTNGIVTDATITIPQPNPSCTLIVPNNVLSAQGLATPFLLVATNPNLGPCSQSNPTQASFVQGAIINTDTGAISIYNPLVIDQGSTPAIPPVVPVLPRNFVIGLWFGTNNGALTLQGAKGNTLAQANCVNGGTNTGIFGQFAYCNAVQFFAQANSAIDNKQLVVPPLGTAADGQPCPTLRDFSVVDMDQSDNVVTTYLISASGKIAQNTKANRAKLNATTEVCGSDNRLLDVSIDPALNCFPWTAPDLADPGSSLAALPLNELQAARLQLAPQAKIPANDPMVLDLAGNPNLQKLNAYRVGVNMRPVASLAVASPLDYCRHLGRIAPLRFVSAATFLQAGPSPDPNVGSNLLTFLMSRFQTAFGPGGLNCTGLLGVDLMTSVTLDHDGIATDSAVDIPDILPDVGTTQDSGNDYEVTQSASSDVTQSVVSGEVKLFQSLFAILAAYASLTL